MPVKDKFQDPCIGLYLEK